MIFAPLLNFVSKMIGHIESEAHTETLNMTFNCVKFAFQDVCHFQNTPFKMT